MKLEAPAPPARRGPSSPSPPESFFGAGALAGDGREVIRVDRARKWVFLAAREIPASKKACRWCSSSSHLRNVVMDSTPPPTSNCAARDNHPRQRFSRLPPGFGQDRQPSFFLLRISFAAIAHEGMSGNPTVFVA